MFKPLLALTVSNAKAVMEEGLRAIVAGQDRIDLSQLTAVDSTAVSTLLVWQRAAHERGLILVFSNLPATLHSLAVLYGVADLLHLDNDARNIPKTRV
jgi:phospholipid transport system transporter-binding protein